MKPITALLLVLAALGLASCDNPTGISATLSPTAVGTVSSTSVTEALPATAPAASNEGTPQDSSQSLASPTPVNPVEIEGTMDAEGLAATESAYAAIVAAQPTATVPLGALPTIVPPPTYTFRIVATYPHDPNAFTQGLVIHEGALYEGTGRWGESSIREVVLETGTASRARPLEAQYFGEGIAILNERLYQLTWQEQTGFIYDRASFEPVQTFTYPHEGWGITHDGSRLIVSDGTSTIRFWDPATLQETGRIEVRDHRGPVNRLNELEYVEGEIWANIWLTDLIARISPETGEVVGYIDLTGLLDTTLLTQPVDVLNGIAYDPVTGRVFVTGKLWPSLFEIQVIPASQ